MAKLTSIQKERFAMAADDLREANVIVVSIKELGLTIGLQYTCDRLQNHMRVAVAQCGPKDQFKVKLGVTELAQKFWNENYITVPVLGRSQTELFNAVIGLYQEDTYIYDVQCRYL
jgi:hypothetical protein